MSEHVRIQTGDVEPIQVYATDKAGAALTGKTDLFVRVRRESDGLYLDHSDDTFKALGWTTRDAALVEVDATLAPGIYGLLTDLDTGAFTNPTDDANLAVIPLQTPGTDAVLPPPHELKVGQWPDEIGAALADTELLRYQGAIWIDSANGTAGTVVGFNGVPENPVLGIADGLALAAATGLRAFVIVSGALTLTASLTEWTVELRDESSLDFGGFSVNGSTFSGGILKGAGTGTVVTMRCLLEDIVGCRILALHCGVSGTIDIAAGESTFAHCYSAHPGTGTPTLKFAPGATANVRAYSGGMKTEDMVAGNTATLEYVAGQLVIDGSCTGGALVYRGNVFPVADTSAGTTVIDNSTATAVWSSNLAAWFDRTIAGGMLNVLRMKMFNRREIDFSGQREVLYKDDASTEHGDQTLADGTGGPVVTATGAPSRIGGFTP